MKEEDQEVQQPEAAGDCLNNIPFSLAFSSFCKRCMGLNSVQLFMVLEQQQCVLPLEWIFC